MSAPAERPDPVAALRQLQQSLAEAPWPDAEREGGLAAGIAYSDGLQEASRTAGQKLDTLVSGVEELVADLRRKLAEADPFGPDASEPGWYGSVWACPLPACQWTHREPSAVSSVDVEAAERVRRILTRHVDDHATKTPLAVAEALVTRMTDWPAHCSEWIAGPDPENPDMCPEYASPGTDKCAVHDPHHQGYLHGLHAALFAAKAAAGHPLGVRRQANLLHGGHPEVLPKPAELGGCVRCGHLLTEATGIPTSGSHPGYMCRNLTACLVRRRGLVEPFPPPDALGRWVPGFAPGEESTAWRCQCCGQVHSLNPRRCDQCGYTVMDPVHRDTTEARAVSGEDRRDYIATGQLHLTDCPGYTPHCQGEKCNRCRHCGWTAARHENVQALRDCRRFISSGAVCIPDRCTTCGYVENVHPDRERP